MTHPVQTILEECASRTEARVLAKGTKVFVHRRLTLDKDQADLPAISFDYGEDTPAETQPLAAIISVLSVEATAVVKAPTERDVREKLIELRGEIHRAVMTDTKLGHGEFVLGIAYGGASAPEIDATGDEVVGEQVSTWLVRYGMGLTDPEN